MRDAHPGLEIESCSSGGGRVDLGVLELTDRVWVSDNSDPHDRQSMMRWTVQLAPPEFLGAHIASDRSHTTGRRMDLSFRAGTALFGHFGIEWDLAEASEDELAVLDRWIEFYRLSVRSCWAATSSGSTGRTRASWPTASSRPTDPGAIFSVAVLDSVHPDPPARLRLRGLDPARRYRVAPLFIGALPSGLQPPAWWGEPSDTEALAAQEYWHRTERRDVSFAGAEFRGDAAAEGRRRVPAPASRSARALPRRRRRLSDTKKRRGPPGRAPSRRPLLDRARRQASHEEALQCEEDDERHEQGDERPGRDALPALSVLAEEACSSPWVMTGVRVAWMKMYATRKSFHTQRNWKIANDASAGHRHRHDEPPEDLEVARAVDAGGLDQRVRQGLTCSCAG